MSGSNGISHFVGIAWKIASWSPTSLKVIKVVGTREKLVVQSPKLVGKLPRQLSRKLHPCLRILSFLPELVLVGNALSVDFSTLSACLRRYFVGLTEPSVDLRGPRAGALDNLPSDPGIP